MFSALAVAYCVLSCGYCFAPVVCGFLLGCGLWLSFPSVGMTKERAHRVGASSLRGLCGLAMQNKVFRPRKTHNCYPLFLRLYIHQSMSIRNRFATA